MEARNVKAGDVIDQETIKHPWSQTAPASSKRSVWNLSLSIYCCLSKPNMYIYISLSIFMARKQVYRRCVVPCPRYLTGGDTHQLLGCCLGVEHASSSQFSRELWALREAVREDAALPPKRTVRFAFPERVSVAEARRQLAFRGSQTDLNDSSGGWDGLCPFSAFTCQI